MINARKKLGDEIVENYAVYNHDPFQNTVRVGRTPTGVELWFNREFMSCDLKIGIGCITAHVHVGFGGGAKLILPGRRRDRDHQPVSQPALPRPDPDRPGKFRQ